MVQKILKDFAYSSIGHIGYVLAGVATGVVNGYQSSIVYISIYVIMNIGAFSPSLFIKKMDNIKRTFPIYLDQKASAYQYHY